MLSGRQIHGLPVIDLQRKQEIGRITDIVADMASGRLAGFVVSGNSILSRTYYLPSERISQLSLNGAEIDNSSALRQMRGLPDYGGLSTWRGSRLLSSTGADSGIVADVFLDASTICGLEISQGIFGDLSNQRSYVSLDNVQPAGGSFMEIDHTE